MKKIIIIFLALAMMLSIGRAVLAETAASSVTLIDTSAANENCYKSGNCSPCDLIKVGVRLTDIIMALSGAVAMLMFVLGGIMMITAYGSDRMNAGKNIVVATVFGLVIVFTAWILVNTVILSFYGATSGAFPTALKTFSGNSSWSSYNCQ